MDCCYALLRSNSWPTRTRTATTTGIRNSCLEFRILGPKVTVALAPRDGMPFEPEPRCSKAQHCACFYISTLWEEAEVDQDFVRIVIAVSPPSSIGALRKSPIAVVYYRLTCVGRDYRPLNKGSELSLPVRKSRIPCPGPHA